MRKSNDWNDKAKDKKKPAYLAIFDLLLLLPCHRDGPGYYYDRCGRLDHLQIQYSRDISLDITYTKQSGQTLQGKESRNAI